MQKQLTLSVHLQDEAKLDNFFVADNQEVIASLRKLIAADSCNYVFLYGPKDVGKSHLLQACCHYAAHQGLRSFYLPFGQELKVLVFENLDHFSLVCIDNVELIAGQCDWEEALFHFFNRATVNNIKLLIAGAKLPSQLPFSLPDLQSRLISGITYSIKPLSDEQKLAALQLRAEVRGFFLSDEVARYLLTHYPRNMTGLFELLEILDQASLRAHHRLTLPFVKSILNNVSVTHDK
jgi:DnaA-homolog protein